MEEKVLLNVLWVDDLPTEEFMDEAYKNGLCITSATSVNKGLSLLKDKELSDRVIFIDESHILFIAGILKFLTQF